MKITGTCSQMFVEFNHRTARIPVKDLRIFEHYLQYLHTYQNFMTEYNINHILSTEKIENHFYVDDDFAKFFIHWATDI